MEEALKNCPLCGKTPTSTGIEAWCKNKECKLYNLPIPREDWQMRPIEAAKEEKIIMLREDLQRSVNSFIELKRKHDALQKKHDNMMSDIETARTSLVDAKKTSQIMQETFDAYKKHSSEEISTLQTRANDEKKAAAYFKESAQNSINSLTVLQNKYDALQKKYDSLVSDMETIKASLIKTKREYEILEESFDVLKESSTRENNVLRNQLDNEVKANSHYKESTEKRVSLLEETLQNKYNILQRKYEKAVSDMETMRASFVKIKGEYTILEESFNDYQDITSRENSKLQNKLNDEKKANEHYKENAEKRISILEESLGKIYNASSDILKSTKAK